MADNFVRGKDGGNDALALSAQYWCEGAAFLLEQQTDTLGHWFGSASRSQQAGGHLICILHGYLLEGSGSNLWTRA